MYAFYICFFLFLLLLLLRLRLLLLLILFRVSPAIVAVPRSNLFRLFFFMFHFMLFVCFSSIYLCFSFHFTKHKKYLIWLLCGARTCAYVSMWLDARSTTHLFLFAVESKHIFINENECRFYDVFTYVKHTRTLQLSEWANVWKKTHRRSSKRIASCSCLFRKKK